MKIYVLALLVTVAVAAAQFPEVPSPIVNYSSEGVDDNMTMRKNENDSMYANQDKSSSLESEDYTEHRDKYLERIVCRFSHNENLCSMLCMYQKQMNGKCQNKVCTCVPV